jgi:hypothetical protein
LRLWQFAFQRARATVPQRRVHWRACLPIRRVKGEAKNIPRAQPVDIFRDLTPARPLLTLCDLFSVTRP